MKTIELLASYYLQEETALLQLDADLGFGLILTVIHERLDTSVISYDFSGHAQQVLAVRHGESLTLLARHAGRICGCLVNEVYTAETSRQLLLPRGGYNLIVYQARSLEEDRVVPGPTHCSIIPTLATHRITRLAELAQEHYASRGQALPPALRFALPVVAEARKLNDEQHSAQMLILFGTILEELGLLDQEQIGDLYAAATA